MGVYSVLWAVGGQRTLAAAASLSLSLSLSLSHSHSHTHTHTQRDTDTKQNYFSINIVLFNLTPFI